MNKPTRYYSDKQEEFVAFYMNGKRCPNSGAGTWKKGDIIKDDMIIECKTLTKPSKQQTIKKEWINNEFLLSNTRNFVQSLVIEHDESQYENDSIYRYMSGSLCYTA